MRIQASPRPSTARYDPTRFAAGRSGLLRARTRKTHEGQERRDGGQPQRIGPAVFRRQRRGEQGGQHGPRVAGARDAQGCALMLRRIPARRQRQGHGERRPRHAQHDAQAQHLLKGGEATRPDPSEARDDDELAQHARALGSDAVGEQAEDHPEQGARQHGRGDHEALLGGVEVQVSGDLDGQGPEQDPDHEADVEIEKSRKQGRRMSRPEERLERHVTLLAPPPLGELAAPHTRLLFIGPRLRSTLPPHARGRPRAVALRLARRDQLTIGLSPTRQRPCWAHKSKRSPGDRRAFQLPPEPAEPASSAVAVRTSMSSVGSLRRGAFHNPAPREGSDQNRKPVSIMLRVWRLAVPADPKAKPGVASTTAV